jgi:RimJ/RimL family protein N-acetyltransferase
MLIEGRHIHLIYFQDQHLNDPVYYRWLHDLNVVKYIGRDELLEGISFSDVEAYIRLIWENENSHFFAVYHTQSGTFIGTAKINFVKACGHRNDLGDVGIMIGDRRFWGQGLATDVLQTLSKFAFNELGARKLSAGAMSLNTAMVKAFLRVGYLQEGRLRQHSLVEGVYCDHVILGCLKNELL